MLVWSELSVRLLARALRQTSYSLDWVSGTALLFFWLDGDDDGVQCVESLVVDLPIPLNNHGDIQKEYSAESTKKQKEKDNGTAIYFTLLMERFLLC